MINDSVSVIHAAQQVGVDKRTIFKTLKRLGIETFMERSSAPDHRGQAIAHISLDDFEFLCQELASRNAALPESDTSDAEFLPVEAGVFYLIQLEPDHDPGRFKVGFAVNISERLRSHRCSAPFAIVVKTWPCKRLWERTVIDCVTAGCEQLHTEVFRTTDLNAVVARCDQFFSMMPEVHRSGQSIGGTDAEQSARTDADKEVSALHGPVPEPSFRAQT